MPLRNLSPAEVAQQGEVEGRDDFVRENAPALLAQHKAKIARQAGQITRLEGAVRSLRTEVARLQERLAKEEP